MNTFRASALAFLIAAGLVSGCLVPGIRVGTQVTGGQTSGGPTGGSGGTCLVLSEAALDFGYVPVGTTTTQQVALTNQCNALLTIADITVEGPDLSLFVVGLAPATLGPSGFGTTSISYSPIAYTGESTAAVTFSLSDGEAVTLNLSGHPIGSPLRLSPTAIDFGFVRLMTTVIGCTTVTNYSSAAIDVTGVASFTTEGGTFALSPVDDSTPPNPAPIPVSIPGGGSAKLCFSFTPPITQQYSGQATLVTDNPAVISPTMELTGWGGGPHLSCTPTSIDFGQTLDHSVTSIQIVCWNTGSAIPDAGLLVELEIVGPQASAFSAELAPPGEPMGGFAPGQSFEIDLLFMPGDGGDYDATLVVESNAGDVKIPLSLQGLNVPPCQFVISPAALDFANVLVGDTSAMLSFEVENVGTDTCKVQGLTINGNDANEFGFFSTSLDPDSAGRYTIPAPAAGVDSSLAVTLGFAPTVLGTSFSAEVAFSISDPSMPNQVVPLSGTSESNCLAVTPTNLDFGDAGLDDAGEILATPQHFFSVSNICDSTARLASIALQSGPGDLVPQYSAVSGPSLPALIAAGASPSFGLSCAPTTAGAHPAELILSDGNVETLVALSCNAP